MFGYIYKTTNKVTGQFYIGKKHKSKFIKTYLGSGTRFNYAVKKYGRDQFTVEPIAWAETLEELNLLEINFIAEAKASGLSYNIAHGGDGGDIISTLPNAPEIYSKRAKRIQAWHDSMTPLEKDEWKKSISNNRQGNFREGTHHREESKVKSSNSNKQAWSLDDGTRRAKVNLSMKARRGISTHNSCQVTIDGITYESISKAAYALSISHHLIKQKLKKHVN